MLRMLYYIVIDGLGVYKSCGKGPRLKNILHNLYKMLDKCPTCNICMLGIIYCIVIDGLDVYKSSGEGPGLNICYIFFFYKCPMCNVLSFYSVH